MNLQGHAGVVPHALLFSSFNSTDSQVQVRIVAQGDTNFFSARQADYYIFCDNLAVPETIFQLPHISVYQTHHSFSYIKHQLESIQLNAEWRHACLLSLDGCGVLLTGRPGSGKSSLALRMLCAGYQLISDDIVYVVGIDSNWWGVCPGNLAGWLHLRGRGFIDVRRCFGGAALSSCAEIKVHIHLAEESEEGLVEITKTRENILFSSIERMVLSAKKEENVPEMRFEVAQLSAVINKIRKETVN